jgi:glutathione S-transferase
VPSFNRYILKTWESIPDQEFDELVEKRTVRKHLYRKMGRTGFDQIEVEASMERLRETAKRMEKSLANGLWLVGSQFTLADVSLVPTFVRMEHLGLAAVWADLTRVVDWYARVRERPSFAMTFYDGSLPPLPDSSC